MTEESVGDSDLAQKVSDSSKEHSIEFKRSNKVNQLLHSYDEGRIKVFGDDVSAAKRTEVALPGGRIVHIHKNYQQVGSWGMSGRFDLSPTSYHLPRISIYGRYLSLNDDKGYEAGTIDRDIFTDYKADHNHGKLQSCRG